MKTHRPIAALAILTLAATVTFAQERRNVEGDPFTQNIRPTEALSPQDELNAFHVPPGFKIELVAAEPDIGKPMNIAFDHKGRLWVSSTTTYPFPSPLQKPGNDTLKVISFNPDGSTKSVSTYADGLNIPVGVYPYKDYALAYSIPNISSYVDTDGDGKSDKVTPLIGPFDFSQDTHGMSSNFLRGFDGWVYGCHGWANTSTVHGTDGQPITMPQGHTYRFDTAGRHVEIYTHGQTNPFGLCLDPLGNLYSADSHSKPIYALLRGGQYESLRPHDNGLGMAPHMMTHSHNSTAIASVAYYAAENFPKEFRDNMFVGNVVTSRVNHDTITHDGSSPVAHEAPDLVTTDDPWFRPNQIKLGPDGAFYISDFYNKIIGHYEVPLADPRRDHNRGRIWRLSYVGPEPHAPLTKIPDFSAESPQDLVKDLNNPNLAVRTLATDELTDRIGKDAVQLLTKLLEGTPTPFESRHALWALERLGSLGNVLLTKLSTSQDAGTRVQVMRVLAQRPTLTPDQSQLLLSSLADPDALTRRSAADALGLHPAVQNIPPLLACLNKTDEADTHLVYTLRMSLRDQLESPGTFAALDSLHLADADTLTIIHLCPAIPTADAASYLIRHLAQIPDADRRGLLLHAARYASPADLDSLAAAARERFANDADLQLNLLESLHAGLAERNVPPPPSLQSWALTLAKASLNPSANADDAWTSIAPPPPKSINQPKPTAANIWGYEDRRCADNVVAKLMSSHTYGETNTGTLRSKPFPLPAKLSFYLAGHMGKPNRPANDKNSVRLLDAQTNKVLVEAFPPRNDRAVLVTWDLTPFAGHQGYLEVVDGDFGVTHAWIAFGRLDPAVVPMPSGSLSDPQRRLQDACTLAESYKLKDLTPDLTNILSDKTSSSETRIAAARALAAVGSDAGVPLLATLLSDAAQPQPLRDQVAATLAPSAATSAAARDALVAAFKSATSTFQLRLASLLSSTPAGSAAFLDAVAAGKAPAALLQDPTIVDRLTSANVPDLKSRLAALTKGLPSPSAALQQTIANRIGTWRFMRPDPAKGAQVFAKNCVICHSIDGAGATVGPQLDGIGNRGLDRVVEDILDPNRNVDPAFRYLVIHTSDGNVLTGLPRNETPTSLTLLSPPAAPVTVQKKDITKRSEGRGSPMPSNFADAIGTTDFYDLLSFLLAHKAK